MGIGLGYLALDRPSGTLSGGEAQRTKMIRHLGSSLTDVTYVFDEPTIGLHPHDIQRMNELLVQLRDKGNTVLVVEHKPEVIDIADHVVDLGPRAGTAGGEVVFEGSVEGLRASDTITGRHLDDRAALKESVRTPTGVLEVRGASTHNLRDVDVDIPLGVLVVVTGVAGSGKTSLIRGSVAGLDGVVAIDQGAIKGSRRSNPATYTGLLEPIRKAFAKANGVKPALFSANSEGACPTCNGAGVTYTDLATMAGVATTCEDCDGKRFQAAVLEYRLGGRDISEVLAMSVTDAEQFFGEGEARTPAAHKVLERLADVGLGYITLGQPLPTLSGGERQRLKLATHMGEQGGVYVLDEPTNGLHLADVERLLALLDRLVDSGKSVVVIEHHQAVMAHADRIIDLGPGAGHDGGRIVFEGTPADLVAARSTRTGEHLAAYVGTLTCSRSHRCPTGLAAVLRRPAATSSAGMARSPSLSFRACTHRSHPLSSIARPDDVRLPSGRPEQRHAGRAPPARWTVSCTGWSSVRTGARARREVHPIGTDRYLAPAAENFIAAVNAIPASDMTEPTPGYAEGTILLKGEFRHGWPASGDPASVADAKRAAGILEDLIAGNAAGASLLDRHGARGPDGTRARALHARFVGPLTGGAPGHDPSPDSPHELPASGYRSCGGGPEPAQLGSRHRRGRCDVGRHHPALDAVPRERPRRAAALGARAARDVRRCRRPHRRFHGAHARRVRLRDLPGQGAEP